MSTLDSDRWKALSPYLDQALDMSDAERPAWLTSLREKNPELARELGMLLDEHRAVAEEGFLEDSPVAPPRQPGLAGETIGADTFAVTPKLPT